MVEQVIQIISEVKNDPALLGKLHADADIMNESGMDSLMLIHFIVKIEEVFQVVIDFEQFDLEHLATVQTFCSFIESQQNGVSYAG